MLMDNTLELLGITDSNIKITRFSAESVNGEKRNVIEAREGITATGIARICHGSPSSVIRIIDEAVELKSRVARLPENLCFDEFRSVNSTMSFICCDAEGSHDIVAILENRLTKTIREHFMNRYTNRERAAVKSVVVDLNAQYIKFIKALFPNARIIIDRFHIVQLVGRALGNARISLMKKMNDCHCREYKILKAHWRLFHKDSADQKLTLEVFLRQPL